MSLKNNLKTKQAQAMVEYIVILVIVIALIFLATTPTSFLNRINSTLANYHNRMIDRVATE